MTRSTRRSFLKTGLAAGALASVGELPLLAAGAKATDQVVLGRSGVSVTRLAFGTGTHSGAVQRNLGQEGFTRLVRHAYDRGIRFFETADSYDQMHTMLGVALRGLPRESYQLMSKIDTSRGVDPQEHFDDLRRQARTEYFDIMLLHVQRSPTWPTDRDPMRWKDGIERAQERKAIVARGASIHGLPGLRAAPGDKWLQVAMIRMNHKGTRMDAEEAETDEAGNVPEVTAHVQQVRREGMGVISMKLVGEGSFTTREDRQKAMRYAFRTAGVQTVTVGYKSASEVDEAIENLNLALA